MHIRDAGPDDVAAVQSLTLKSYAEYADVMAPAAWASLRNAVLSGLTLENEAHHIVAELDGRVVGSVLLYPPGVAAYSADILEAGAWPEVRLLAVSPDARGHGVARALMGECIRRSLAWGATYLGLHTSRSMRAAIGLYQAMGFERVPELDFVVEGSEVVEGYRLRITPPSGAPDPV